MASVLKTCTLLVGLVTAILGVLTEFYPLISFYPYLGVVISSSFLKSVHYINVASNPLSDGFCYSLFSPFTYSNCPTSYYLLALPFDSLPLLPAVFVMTGLLTGGLSFTRLRNKFKTLFLSMSAGLTLVLATSQLGWIAEGWPIRWVVYPIHHIPAMTFEPAWLDVVAFAANWVILGAIVFLIAEAASKAVYHSWNFAPRPNVASGRTSRSYIRSRMKGNSAIGH